MIRVLSPQDADYSARLDALTRRTASLPENIESSVRDIIAAVRGRGDAAVRELTSRFEKRDLERLEMGAEQWDALAAKVEPPTRAALEHAAARVRAFHERERYSSYELDQEGVRLGCRYTALQRVGIYVPGGTALYPSTVLMTAVPAKVAGVNEVVMVTPGPSPETMAAARISGVDRVFVIGGAQAVAALAYGTESVPRVDKIVGPGNAYVAAAKRQVFGDVGIDSVAGPTEVVIAADETANPRWIAADMLAQAEHDVMACAVLLAIGPNIALRVRDELERQLQDLPRRAIAERSLREQGCIVVVPDLDTALDLMNRLAPEHAELACAGARDAIGRVRTAGAIFVGMHTPEPVGDYFAGPSHVLPTGGSARFASPLGVADFMKRTSVIEYSAAALATQSAEIRRLAEVEGLHAHGRAVGVRGM